MRQECIYQILLSKPDLYLSRKLDTYSGHVVPLLLCLPPTIITGSGEYVYGCTRRSLLEPRSLRSDILFGVSLSRATFSDIVLHDSITESNSEALFRFSLSRAAFGCILYVSSCIRPVSGVIWSLLRLAQEFLIWEAVALVNILKENHVIVF